MLILKDRLSQYILRTGLVRKISFFSLVLCVAVFLTGVCFGQPEELRVTRVIDGDTIVLEDGRHVRYIGVDTPEKGYPYYYDAKKENERLVKGKTVRLEYDIGKTDRYGRTLAYVYEGAAFINAELVKNGYAVIATFPPNVRYAETFLTLQEEARNRKCGLWGLSRQDIKQNQKKSFWDYLTYRFKRLVK